MLPLCKALTFLFPSSFLVGNPRARSCGANSFAKGKLIPAVNENPYMHFRKTRKNQRTSSSANLLGTANSTRVTNMIQLFLQGPDNVRPIVIKVTLFRDVLCQVVKLHRWGIFRDFRLR